MQPCVARRLDPCTMQVGGLLLEPIEIGIDQLANAGICWASCGRRFDDVRLKSCEYQMFWVLKPAGSC
jgi:hypothetical protein